MMCFAESSWMRKWYKLIIIGISWTRSPSYEELFSEFLRYMPSRTRCQLVSGVEISTLFWSHWRKDWLFIRHKRMRAPSARAPMKPAERSLDSELFMVLLVKSIMLSVF
ncbi:hypothetical protein BpHYR1_012948 [Brachionus plicatilis]|uniref:Uncharacterized protein n=1 Tax=Brachionus plicatilis TaxID=10195 RepID=A0A3M7RBT6_BRAPC|nr:hypothetical protein BpHYR1_012948 [Brachionus plicatilis]